MSILFTLEGELDRRLYWIQTLLGMADCLPSSLDSKAEEKKYVSNVLYYTGIWNVKTGVLAAWHF